MGFECRSHNMRLPCYQCKKEAYDYYLKENENGKDPPHDLTDLKKDLETHGIKV